MRSIAQHVLGLATVVALAAPASIVHAQTRVELGIDASAIFGLGDQSSVDITLPASRFRVGFFQPGSSWSIEPAGGLSYQKVSGVPGVTFYNLELGALYHFGGPVRLSPAAARTAVAPLVTPYLRPFVGVSGATGGGDGDHEFSAGAGLGVKIPWRTNLDFRGEANLGYGFTNKAARLGLFAGLSFFPR